MPRILFFIELRLMKKIILLESQNPFETAIPASWDTAVMDRLATVVSRWDVIKQTLFVRFDRTLAPMVYCPA